MPLTYEQLIAQGAKPITPIKGLTYDELVNQGAQTPSISNFRYNQPTNHTQLLAQAKADAVKADENAKFANSALGFTSNFVKAGVDTIASSEVGLGNTIGKIIGTNKYTDTYTSAINNIGTVQQQLIRLIAEKKARGEDTGKLEKYYNDNANNLDSLQKGLGELNTLPTTSQVVGQLGGTALDLATAGTYGKATKGMKAFNLATELPSTVKATAGLVAKPSGLLTKKGLTKVAEGTAIGYGFDVTQGLQGNRGEDRTGAGALIPGLNTLIGAGFPILTEGVKSLTKLKPSALQEHFITQAEEDWQKTGSDYVKSNKILTKGELRGKDTPSFLAQRGIDPQSLVVGGKYQTQEMADRIAQVDTKPFEQVLNTSLKVAEQGQPPLSIAQLEREALNNANKAQGLTLGQKQTIKNSLLNEFSLLREQYGDTIKLTDLNKEKQTYWTNTKFDMNKPLQGDTHYIIGSTFKNAIENNVNDVNIKEMNSFLGDHYEASKFLRSIDNRVPKATILDRIKRGVIKGVTTAVGAKLGGGIPGGVAGYSVGQAIATALEQFSNPLKTYFLNNLEKTNPAAYEEAIKWISQQEAERLKRPLLEAPKPLGSKENPIIPTAPTTFESAAQQSTLTSTNKTGDVFQRDVKTGKMNIIPNKQGGFISTGYKETGNLTTKILQKLEGKTEVSKQFISDLTNSGDLKQVERDLIRSILETEKGAKVNVQDFADKVKAELLPLNVKSSDVINAKAKDHYASNYMVNEGDFSSKYENIALPKELRGNVANYKENIYQSPIATSAGNTHFQYNTKNYFGHTRIEDMADNSTRRVIEVQSDLYQKGNLEKEKVVAGVKNPITREGKSMTAARAKEVSKLEQYSNPTAHFRMVREEIKQAAIDNKTKLQFPTGETAMKIEGLGDSPTTWIDITNKDSRPAFDNWRDLPEITPDTLKVGKPIEMSNQPGEWIITDVLGDGKFKAIQKTATEKYANLSDIPNSSKETFDISGKVDTSNPIYKFYEKDLGNYLRNNFKGQVITDKKGVKWVEVPVTKDMATKPVTAFGKIKNNPLIIGAAATGAAAIGASAYAKSKKKNQ